MAGGRTDAAAAEQCIEDDLVPLAAAGLLKGAQVFAASGKRLGRLTGAVVHRPAGGIASVELERSRLFGLLRRRLSLPRQLLTGPDAGGRFTVPWPLPDALAPAQGPKGAGVRRLDPARGEQDA